jgi:drug/metabolite transporter (DMT)-like permease
MRTFGLVASVAAVACLAVSLGMWVRKLPRVRLPRVEDVQQPLAWVSIGLGIAGAAAALAAWLFNRRGRVERLGLLAAFTYAAFLTYVLLFFQ